MWKHRHLACLFIPVLLLLATAVWADDDPGFWTDPFITVPSGDDTPDPDFWDDPFLSDEMVDNLPDPEFWIDPFNDGLIAPEYDLPDLGLPTDIDEVIARGTPLNVNVLRGLVGGMYNTLCLPFAVPSFDGTPLEGAQVLAFEDAVMENGALSIYFHNVGAVEAGIPYLVQPPADVPSPMRFEGVTLSTAEGQTSYGTQVNFIGILEPTPIPNDGCSLFLASNNRLRYSNAASNLRGLRAYFYVTPVVAAAPARICIGRRPVTTDLEPTQIQTAATKYITGGRLLIRKGNLEYDVLGIPGTK